MMRKKYIKPVMNARWFGDKIITGGDTGAGAPAVTASVTAAQDVINQTQNYMLRNATSGTVTTVKLESIIGYQK